MPRQVTRSKRLMEFKENTAFLMLKINTPPDIDFLKEHKSILDKYGEVWFCRFGKSNVIKSKITEDGSFVFFKDSAKNNNRIYVGNISAISVNSPLSNYPEYYQQIHMEQAFWLRLIDIDEVDPSQVMDNFRIKSSNASLDGVYRSMCNSFYIKCVSNVIL